jgi:cell division transport system permease protein
MNARKTKEGASQQRARSGDRFNSYLDNHKRVARESWQRLLKNPVSNLMTWLVIGIALALPGGLYVTLSNLEAVSQQWDGKAQLSLFIHQQVAEQDSRKLAKKLQLRDDIADVSYISPTQALAEFQRQSRFGNVLESLDSNPLPAVLIISPQSQHGDAINQLFTELQALPQVDQAILDLEWVQRLHSMMKVGQRMTLTLAALLSMGVLLVIGNTIRLAIESRRDEIVIVKLVGGTNAFVRRPFLYTGLWYGLGGGLMAWLIINISLYLISSPVAELSGLYQSQFRLQGLGAANTLLLWLSSALLGLAGAWLAASRHLSQIEPR